MTPAPHRLRWLTIYALAMGLLEASVVVYLRELYYPRGFEFPVVIIPERIAVVELLRELSTVVMMLAVAVLAGSDRHDRFWVFAYQFGVWDLVYYAGLWGYYRWPGSLATWDVLFLIPVPWLGPVVYPITIAVLLLVGFFVHEGLRRRGRRGLHLTRAEWAVAIAGAVLVIVAFCWNWRAVAAEIVPTSFPVGLFATGTAVGVAPFVRAGIRRAG